MNLKRVGPVFQFLLSRFFCAFNRHYTWSDGANLKTWVRYIAHALNFQKRLKSNWSQSLDCKSKPFYHHSKSVFALHCISIYWEKLSRHKACLLQSFWGKILSWRKDVGPGEVKAMTVIIRVPDIKIQELK